MARIPNVFTAFANVVAGVYLARAGRFEARDGLLVAASGALYLGGMVLNDLFDRRIDAVERPERPIPSGAVTPAAAAILGFGLLALGIMLAGLFGVRTLAVAVALTAAILLYDGRVKGTGWGPLAMGTCR
ncbi:MAG TPA: UbiA family prenyltransferase, partial [Polyangia bacterium]|nr:UbiA family prenyltransferase [Polyangia bacterium]